MADPRLVLLVPDGAEKLALLASLESRLEIRPRSRLPKDLEDCDLLWIHRGPEDGLEGLEAEEFARIRAYVERGGRLLLTGRPAAWTGQLGIEDRPPEIRDAVWTGPVRAEERLGLAPFLGHPLFERFPGGLYLRRPKPGTRLSGAWYEDGERPVQGRLLAVEKVHLGMDPRRGLLIEHHHGEGRVLSLGAHLVFAEDPGADPFREARLRFAGDLVDDLLSAGQELRGRAWPEPMSREASWKLEEGSLEEGSLSAGSLDEGPEEEAPEEEAKEKAKEGVPGESERTERLAFAPLGLERFDRESFRMAPEPDPGSYYDLVGNCGDLLVGEAGCGPKELWHLPLRLFRDHGLGIDGEAAELVSWELWPYATSRKVRAGSAEAGPAVVQEYWTVGTKETGTACSYHLVEGGKAQVEIAFTCDHRMLWPYAAGALGTLLVKRDESGRRMEIRDESGVGLLCIAWSRRPRSFSIEDAGGEGGIRIRLAFDLESDTEGSSEPSRGDRVEALFVAGLDAEVTRQRMQALASGESDLVAEVLAQARSREVGGLSLDLGDAKLNEELAWIRSKGRDFFQQCEHLWEEEDCAGYVAGFQSTQPGWCSGRPGLAWYFGRDGLWTAGQNLLWGDRQEVAAELRLLARHQGPDGQILHELTPSGTLHYDALDATPMFVTLLARYLAWTGDRALVEELFPAVERAIFGQLLPQSVEPGRLECGGAEHAWIEDGPLREDLQADLSLACLVTEALAKAGMLAESLGKEGLALRLQEAAKGAGRRLDAMFKDPESGLHATALHRGYLETGNLETGNLETDCKEDNKGCALTALSVLPFLHGLDTSAGKALPALALERHAADWGHRLLDRDHPGFDPEAYQGGSVWPLVSAWVTKADFASGRSEQGWVQLRGQMSLVRHFAPGIIEEAYSGDRFVPAGVCAHQAWSHAALLSSLAEGLLGIAPSEDGEALILRPSLPLALPEIAFSGLQYRGLILSGRVRRDSEGLELDLEIRGEGEGDLDLSAFFPLPARLAQARLDDEEILVEAKILDEALLIQVDRIRISAGQDLELRLAMEVDLDLEPPYLLPVPGEASTHARLLGRRLEKEAGEKDTGEKQDAQGLTLLVEGPGGQESWPLRLGNRQVASIEGAEIRDGQLHFEIEASDSGFGSKEIRLSFANSSDIKGI